MWKKIWNWLTGKVNAYKEKGTAELDAYWKKIDAALTPGGGTSATNAPPIVVVDPTTPIADSQPTAQDAVDEVAFSSLKWTCGGFKGGGANLSTPRIANLKVKGTSGLSLKWLVGMADWGLSDGDAGALACFFCERADGALSGGKIDWISKSRGSRDFANPLSGYGGWTFSDVKNPAKAAFVVISRDGRKRSNVIAATWSR